MPTYTITVNSQQDAAIRAEADGRGLTPEALVGQVVADRIANLYRAEAAPQALVRVEQDAVAFADGIEVTAE